MLFKCNLYRYTEAATRELAEQVLRETGMRIGDGWGTVWEAAGSRDSGGARKRFTGPDGKKFSSQSKVGGCTS